MTDPKQEIFDILYQFEGGESVLDVGCGKEPLSGIAPPKGGHATGIDLQHYGIDWAEFNVEHYGYDIIIANDLFPNVDQRLELFLEMYLPHCKEMRLSLTYFDEPHWYRATRPEGEVITMLAWTRKQITNLLPWSGCHTKGYQGEFPNGRKVLLVWLKGGLA